MYDLVVGVATGFLPSTVYTGKLKILLLRVSLEQHRK